MTWPVAAACTRPAASPMTYGTVLGRQLDRLVSIDIYRPAAQTVHGIVLSSTLSGRMATIWRISCKSIPDRWEYSPLLIPASLEKMPSTKHVSPSISQLRRRLRLKQRGHHRPFGTTRKSPESRARATEHGARVFRKRLQAELHIGGCIFFLGTWRHANRREAPKSSVLVILSSHTPTDACICKQCHVREEREENIPLTFVGHCTPSCRSGSTPSP